MTHDHCQILLVEMNYSQSNYVNIKDIINANRIPKTWELNQLLFLMLIQSEGNWEKLPPNIRDQTNC